MNREIRDITISTLVISFAFGWGPILLGIRSGAMQSAVQGFLVALMAVGLGFILHELAHRVMARRFGSFAEFRAWRTGLIMAVATAVISGGNIVFAAPGAVHIQPRTHSRWYKLDRRIELEEMGIISIVGPITNLILSGVFMLLGIVTGLGFFSFAASINAWLALFNSFPIPPLDGSKIITWDVKAWMLLIGVSVVALILA